jgi:hypothetical protein
MDVTLEVVAGKLLSRLLGEIETNKKIENPQEIVEDMYTMLLIMVNLSEGFRLLKYYLLVWFQDAWEELSLSWRSQFGNEFNLFACQITRRQWRAVEDNMKTARVFLVDKLGPSSGVVEVPKRDVYGQLTVDSDMVQTEKVVWDATVPPIGKLTAVRSVAEAGKMTDKLWGMVYDPTVTVDDIRDELYTGEDNHITSPEITFGLAGPLLIAKQFGEEVEIGELFFELRDQSQVARTAIDRILKFLRVVPDEEAIVRHSQKGDVQRAYRDKKI